MNSGDADQLKQRKAEIRQQAHAIRNQQPNKVELSRHICASKLCLNSSGSQVAWEKDTESTNHG
jgi:hypothetical protein